MKSFCCTFASLLLSCILSGAVNGQTESLSPDQEKINVAVEALSRIEGNVNTSPGLSNAVTRILLKVRGTPNFVAIVKKFDLKDQNEGLVEIAEKVPSTDFGVEAIRLILKNDAVDLLNRKLSDADEKGVANLVEALGNAQEKKANALLVPLLTSPKVSLAVRKKALQGLAQTQEGAGEVLQIAKAGKLPDDLTFAATSLLNSVRWAAIQSEAVKILPPLVGKTATPLPPISELVKMHGDAANGSKVFFREVSGCINCHKVKDTGGDIGPALTEIGTKLPKEALCEAILDPSAGISVGFEGFSLELKSGDEAYGLLANETAEEIAIKDLKGIITRFKKSEVVKKTQLKTSIMPTGLQATMTTQ
ncbi:MAG: rane-bound dehydrogenase domain protein, partial [Verrucomicrobiales bacterium]|nr:rane-bound dehydrogenase domain protein [Verrucomicrobiales bacterium]